MMRKRIVFGLSDYLSDQCNISEIIYSTQHSNFDVIFSGRFPPNPVELLSTDTFSDMLNRLKNIYDYIIVDCPPIGAVVDAAVIAANCDGVLFIIANGQVKIREAKDSKKQLEKSGCKILGAVMNDISNKQKNYFKRYYKSKYYN